MENELYKKVKSKVDTYLTQYQNHLSTRAQVFNQAILLAFDGIPEEEKQKESKSFISQAFRQKLFDEELITLSKTEFEGLIELLLTNRDIIDCPIDIDTVVYVVDKNKINQKYRIIQCKVSLIRDIRNKQNTDSAPQFEALIKSELGEHLSGYDNNMMNVNSMMHMTPDSTWINSSMYNDYWFTSKEMAEVRLSHTDE